MNATGEAEMERAVQYREYVFGGLRRRSLSVDGAGIVGTATEQRSGGWAWFLRHPDGSLAGEGRAATWDDALRDIHRTLAAEETQGRLGYLRRETSP